MPASVGDSSTSGSAWTPSASQGSRPPEQALHPRGDPRQHAADLVIGRRRQRPELDRPFLTLEEEAVEEQRVEMDVEIQSAPEALDDRHRARSPVADAIAAGRGAAGSPAARARTRRAPPAPARDPTRASTEAGTADSAPTGARAPAAAPRPPAEPRSRSCAGRRSSGRSPAPCTKTAPAARACTPCTVGARSRAPGSRRSESRRTLAPRRQAAARRPPAAGSSRGRRRGARRSRGTAPRARRRAAGSRRRCET